MGEMAVKRGETGASPVPEGKAEPAPLALPPPTRPDEAHRSSFEVVSGAPAHPLTHWMDALAPTSRVRLLGPAQVEAEFARLKALGVEVSLLGASSQGRPIHALKVGRGPLQVAVLAGAHADEPVGTSTALHFAEQVHTLPALENLRAAATFHLVPMANPDGSARNEGWFEAWAERPELSTYLLNVRRDLPPNDVEFGFPQEPGGTARPENAALARWLDGLGPLDHFVSLHSMFLGGGALFLALADDLAAAAPAVQFALGQVERLGLPLHDKDRFGQKGFFRLGPGLHTAPTAEAMRAFFASSNVDFKLNSMQYVQRHNGCPLALVSEIPLCFDPRLASMVEVAHSRADEERRLAQGLAEVAAQAQGDCARLAALVPAGHPAVERMASRLGAARATASALLNDLGRYGDHRATEGNVMETDLMLRRRRAELLSLAISTALELGPAAAPLAVSWQAALGDQLAALAEAFPLQTPSLESQLQAQQAAILAALAFASRRSP